MARYFYILLFQLFLLTCLQAQRLYKCVDGRTHFKSEAPLEIIEAESNKLKGAIDLEKRTFAFTIEMVSFEGFNNPLQRVHFSENYLESDQFPEASFHGKIIDKQTFEEGKEYIVRAKGKLKIHGVTQERIIKSKLKIENGKLKIRSFFTVLLEEHDISIPKIVTQKIAEEIKVLVEAEFLKA